jgi:hypothetical protein
MPGQMHMAAKSMRARRSEDVPSLSTVNSRLLRNGTGANEILLAAHTIEVRSKLVDLLFAMRYRGGLRSHSAGTTCNWT